MDNMSVVDFCKNILQSKEYRDFVIHRIYTRNLPPAIEQLFYHYAYGKPVERLEHTGANGAPINTVTEIRRVIVRPAVDMYDESDDTRPDSKMTH
jgi:hypothetical protein